MNSNKTTCYLIIGTLTLISGIFGGCVSTGSDQTAYLASEIPESTFPAFPNESMEPSKRLRREEFQAKDPFHPVTPGMYEIKKQNTQDLDNESGRLGEKIILSPPFMGQKKPFITEKANEKSKKFFLQPGKHPNKNLKDSRAKLDNFESTHLAPDLSTEIAKNSEDELVFNFDDADLYEVVRTMANLLEINYIVEGGVRGKVTIHSAGSLKRSDLFDIFFQILEANGLTAVEEGNLYKIGPMKDAPRSPIPTHIGTEYEGIGNKERVIMQIIPLKYMAAEEMTKLLKPFISADGTIIAHGDSNTLLIVDRDINIAKALELIKVFDIDIFRGIRHEFYNLNFLDSDEMASLLREYLGYFQSPNEQGFKIIPIKRLSMLLLIGKEDELFSRAESLINQLDVPIADVTPRIYVYYVKNGNAEELAGLLNQVFGDAESISKAPTESPQESKNPYAPPNPFEKTSQDTVSPPKSNAKKESPLTTVGHGGTGTLRKPVKITPDENRNALIIEGIPSDYLILEDILEKLDVLPRQVLIEVVIAEISHEENENLGVEWNYRKGDGGGLGLSLLSAQMSSAGLQFIIGETDRWSAAFSALASQSKVNILSAPVVLASDNKEANINVSDKIPVASAEYIYNTGNEGVTQTNIQYRDTGIILSVTPHINERGLVSMEVSQEVSEQGDGVNVGGQSYPSFRERSVNTACTVKNGQTLIMGGLMRERESKGRSGVPFFSKLPGIGFLFGKDSESYTKTELILLITPRVIVSLEDIDAVTEDFKQRVAQIQHRHIPVNSNSQ